MCCTGIYIFKDVQIDDGLQGHSLEGLSSQKLHRATLLQDDLPVAAEEGILGATQPKDAVSGPLPKLTKGTQETDYPSGGAAASRGAEAHHHFGFQTCKDHREGSLR